MLNSEDAHIYHELRLRSLMESPESYLTTYEDEKEKPIEKLMNNLIPSDNRFTLGGFIDNFLTGVVTFVRESNSKTTHKGNVYALYVSPEFRGQGIGKALMLELKNRARQCIGLEQLNLTVISDNTAAKRLYVSVGFITYGKEERALKSGEQYWDEELMALKLN